MPRPPSRPLPPPLPPERRTVGQLVAETLRFYGAHFWRAVSLGVLPAVLALTLAELDRGLQLIVGLTVGALVYSGCYVAACVLVSPRPVRRESIEIGFIVGVLAYLPVPILAVAFLLPALAWLAFVGMAVPAAVMEGHRLRAAFARGRQLARADYVHVLGSLATLAIVALLCHGVLFLLLRGAGDETVRVASFLASLVIEPVLFLGSALLYFDQAARAVSSRPKRTRSGDAEVPAADDAHGAGRPNAELEPRPAPGGQP